MPRAKYKCGFCGKPNHNARTCDFDSKRAAEIDAANAKRNLEPQANPAHWEILNSKRALVAAQLVEALSELSAVAPASKHIKRAMALLEDMR